MKYFAFLLTLIIFLFADVKGKRIEKCFSSLPTCRNKFNTFKSNAEQNGLYPNGTFLQCTLKGNQYCFFIVEQ